MLPRLLMRHGYTVLTSARRTHFTHMQRAAMQCTCYDTRSTHPRNLIDCAWMKSPPPHPCIYASCCRLTQNEGKVEYSWRHGLLPPLAFAIKRAIPIHSCLLGTNQAEQEASCLGCKSSCAIPHSQQYIFSDRVKLSESQVGSLRFS